MKSTRPQRSYLLRVIPILGLLLIVLFKFQNCGMPMDAELSADAAGDSEVRIIDRWQQQKITFLSDVHQSEMQEPQYVLHGLCVGETSAAQILYDLVYVNETGETSIQSSGTVDCRMGSFEIDLPEIQFSNCSDRFEVRAVRAGSGDAPALTQIVPACEGEST